MTSQWTNLLIPYNILKKKNHTDHVFLIWHMKSGSNMILSDKGGKRFNGPVCHPQKMTSPLGSQHLNSFVRPVGNWDSVTNITKIYAKILLP